MAKLNDLTTFCWIVISPVLGAMALAGQSNVVTGGHVIPNSTPKFIATARNLGPEHVTESIALSIWLNPRDRSGLDALAAELYDANSSHYHQWITPQEFEQRFAPEISDVKTVEQFLTAHKVAVEMVGPDNLYIRARGSVGDVANAFGVQINRFEVQGRTVRSNVSDPHIEGPAAALIRSVSGLDSMGYTHPLRVQPKLSGKSGSGVKAFAASPDSPFFTPNCFTGPKTESYGNPGSFPGATYTGNSYFASPTEPGCGYVPDDIQTAYNLKALYKEGFDGTGQGIVIIDWCGSPTILDDANAFSARFGLPPLTSANFQIINYPTLSTCSGADPEINIDVEWAHAIAPGAKITLLVPPTASFVDTDVAQLYAELTGFGSVISGSYGAPEALVAPSELDTQNLISEIGAIRGVSANFSSGDSGDFSTATFPSITTVSMPAASPFATSVGGVTLALKADRSIKFQTGWGNNETLLIDEGSIFSPPLNFGFAGGSGGGTSAFFAKPLYQSGLPGTNRLVPDISWLADPFTGGVISITYPGQFPPQIYTVYGGTSLACPMFSALWAIANQEAGVALGQAAALLYGMPASTIKDIVPFSSPNDVTATIAPSSGQTLSYTAAQLAAPLYNTTKFYSALYDYPYAQDTTYVLTFGTDTSLKTTPGWDNVTGLGTPNGKAFADYFNPGR